MSHNTNEQLPSPRSSGQQSGAARAAPTRWAAAALLLTLALGQVAQAVDGQLDPSFGGNGLVTLDIDNLGDQLFGVAILSDGRIAVGGFTGLTGTTGGPLSGDLDFVVGAFSPNGSLDTGFGTGGLTITDIIGPQPVPNDANALVLQQDGKIVLVGRSGPNESPRFAAVRYRADGQPDTGFGDNGMVETPAPGPGSPESNARDVAVQTDGKIILAGVVGSNVLGSPPRAGDIALVRYNQDGSLDDGGPLDTTPGDQFGLDGTVRTTHFGADNFAFALAVAVQLDGKIVAGGEVDPEPPDLKFGDFVLVRYNQDGSLDDGRPDDNGLDDGGLPDSTPGDQFGDNGTVRTDFGLPTDLGLASDDTVTDLVLQPDGKIVAGGSGRGTGTKQFVLARYNVNGTLDPSFGTGGTKTTPFPALGGSMAALVRQQGGKLVAAGTAGTQATV